MSDDEVSNILDEMLRSEYAPPLTDSIVDAFLSSDAECSNEMIDRVRARFAEKVLADFQTNPVKHIEGKLSFGRWVEQRREEARLSKADLSSNLGVDATFVESLETGRTQPWDLKEMVLARIVSLFRLHIDAASDLILRSFALNNVRLRGEVLARSHSGRMSLERGSSTRRALDMYLSKNVSSGEPNEQVIKCLNSLRDELLRLGASDLMD
jgi:transcriptional regulator with XRE-family HTH domain